MHRNGYGHHQNTFPRWHCPDPYLFALQTGFGECQFHKLDVSFIQTFQLLKPNSVFCRKADEIVKTDKKKLADAIDKEYQPLFNFLSLKTGWIVNGSSIADVFNVLHRKHENGVPQPEWVYAVLSNVTELKRRLRTTEFNSDEKSKLRTGYLLGRISKDINSRARGALNKLFVYSTHDATLTSLMYSLGVSNHQLVPYTAALILETHKVDGKHYVKVNFPIF